MLEYIYGGLPRKIEAAIAKYALWPGAISFAVQMISITPRWAQPNIISDCSF